MYVQGGWGWVGEDQGLDREARAVDAILGYPWEGDVDAGEQLALALWAISSRSYGIFGILEPMGPTTYRHRTMMRVEQMKNIKWSHQNRR